MMFLINCANQNVTIKKKMRSILWDQCFSGQLHPNDKEKVVANGIKVFIFLFLKWPILPYCRQNVLACRQHVIGFLYFSTFLSNL